MPDLAAIVLVLIVAIGVVAAAVVVVRRRAPRREERVGGPPASLPVLAEGQSLAVDAGDEVAGVLALPTERPNEIYLFGPAGELDEYGATLATAPPQLARYATGLRAVADGVRSYSELSGRLVLVDDKTAAALRSGKMMKDTGGEILAHVLRDDGKISSVTRLRDVGGLAAGAASLTNAMSAMAMQAQLDRIERQLTVISDRIDTANREMLRQWHAQALGAQDVLREVYSTATRAGELTPSNWTQVASIWHVVRTHIHGDRDRSSRSVAALERLAGAPDVKQRMDELDTKVDAVRSAHLALSGSTRAWAQYSALRLWRFTVTGDPTLGAYREELRSFIESSRPAAQPRGVPKLPLSTIKSGSRILRDPRNRSRAVEYTLADFHYAMTNTLSVEESTPYYERYAIPGAGHILFEGAAAQLNPPRYTITKSRRQHRVDFGRTDRAPMLFIANGRDHVVPTSVTKAIYHKYHKKSSALVAYAEYADRPHFPGVPGWEQVADHALDWALANARDRS